MQTRISDLPQNPNGVGPNDLIELAVIDPSSVSGFSSVKVPIDDLLTLFAVPYRKGAFINSPIALGDSFTLGTGATVTQESYISKLEATNNVTIQNQGIGGVGVWRETSQHFQVCRDKGNINPTTWMVGFNDIRRAGNNPATLKKIKNCLRSCVANAWLATFSPASGVTNTGSWSNVSGFGGKCEGVGSGSARQSSTVGNTLTYTSPVSSTVVIGCFGTDGVNVDGGRFTVSIDGTVVKTYNPNGETDGIYDAAYDNRVTQNVLVFQNLKKTTHTVIITLLDAKPTYIDYFGTLGEPNANPAFIVSDIPLMSAAGQLVPPNNANNTMLVAGTEAQNEVVAEFYDRPIIKVPVNEFLNLSTDISGDDIHPNNLGHTHIAQAFQTAIKNNSDFNIHGNDFTKLTNTIIGYLAATALTTGDDNTIIGKGAMQNATIARQNIAIGFETMKNVSGASNFNTAMGYQALMSLVASTNNTAVGFEALKSLASSGSQNTAFGHQAAKNLASNYNNAVFGALAMLAATSAGFNAVFGADAYKSGNGNNNSMFGYGAGRDSTGSGNVFIGANAGQTELGNNKLIIENSNAAAGSRLIEGDFSARELTFDASIKTKQSSANGAGKWKLGKVITAASNPDATKYVEVEIDGVVVKLVVAS